MLRLLSFLVGIVLGFIGAVIFTPLPGKTFFNKFSRLPKQTQDLIDSSLDIFAAATKLFLTVSEELKLRYEDSQKAAQETIKRLKKDK